MARHLDFTYTSRGFKRMPRIPGGTGENVNVYESSAATEPRIWLQAIAPADRNNPGRDLREVIVELAADDARKLGEQLIWLADNHYQTT